MPRASSRRSESATSSANTRWTRTTSRRSRWRARSVFPPSRSSRPWSAAATDFKAAARISGDRSVEMVPLREVQPLTGYVRGGVTVLGARKDYPAYADETIEVFDVISVSAGIRGTQILLAPSDYLRATKAKVGPLTR